MSKKFYELELKGGHVGKKNYILFYAYLKAENAKDAAEKGRALPRTKHDHKDAVISVREISYEEYVAGLESVKADPYLHCMNVQQQREVMELIKDRIRKDSHFDEFNPDKKRHEKKKSMNPKKMLRYMPDESVWKDYYAA